MRRIVVGAALVALVLATVACGTPAGTGTDSPPPPASVAPSDTPATQPPTAAPVATAPTASGGAPTPAGAVVEDPALLAVLPPDVGGVAVAHEPEGFADAAGDRDFAANVEAAAFAFAADGDNLVSAVVARLKPGVYTDAFFREWRDSYNDGACAQAGGLVGNAETQSGDQTVYIGSCAGGLRTYHAWVASRGVIVSASALGDARFGELLLAGLRP